MAETCDRCQGNGEIVTDWDRYLGPVQPGDTGDEGTEECPDCEGLGQQAAPAWMVRPYESMEWRITTDPPTDELRRWLEYKPLPQEPPK